MTKTTFSIRRCGLLQKRSRFTATVIPLDSIEAPSNEDSTIPGSPCSGNELRGSTFNLSNFMMFGSDLGRQVEVSLDWKTSLHPPPPFCIAVSTDIRWLRSRWEYLWRVCRSKDRSVVLIVVKINEQVARLDLNFEEQGDLGKAPQVWRWLLVIQIWLKMLLRIFENTACFEWTNPDGGSELTDFLGL